MFLQQWKKGSKFSASLWLLTNHKEEKKGMPMYQQCRVDMPISNLSNNNRFSMRSSQIGDPMEPMLDTPLF